LAWRRIRDASSCGSKASQATFPCAPKTWFALSALAGICTLNFKKKHARTQLVRGNTRACTHFLTNRWIIFLFYFIFCNRPERIDPRAWTVSQVGAYLRACGHHEAATLFQERAGVRVLSHSISLSQSLCLVSLSLSLSLSLALLSLFSLSLSFSHSHAVSHTHTHSLFFSLSSLPLVSLFSLSSPSPLSLLALSSLFSLASLSLLSLLSLYLFSPPCPFLPPCLLSLSLSLSHSLSFSHFLSPPLSLSLSLLRNGTIYLFS
jgi:hypothetical protein